MIYDVSGTQFVIYMCVCIYILIWLKNISQIIFHCRLLKDIEYSSLCYTIGLCYLSILCMVVHICRRRQWHPTPGLLPGKSHGWRSLVGCSPWGREELDTTERLHFDFSLSCTGEGNGNPLQCSCLENPRDGEPGGLLSMGSHRVGYDWSDLAAAVHIC